MDAGDQCQPSDRHSPDRVCVGLKDRVHLAGTHHSTEAVYPAFDLLLQTSPSEAMPLVLLEGMACGCPMIAIGVGGVAELIESGTMAF